MKKSLLPIALGLLFGAMVSCGGGEKQVRQFAEKFAGYVNTGQMDSIRAVYPGINFDYVSPVVVDSLAVTQDDKGIYKVNFAAGRWIEIKEGENGEMTVTASKGIAAFPPDLYEIAVNTGMVTDTVTDVMAQTRMQDNAYFEWLKRNVPQPIGLVKGKISKKYGVDFRGNPCECGTERMTCTVTNNTNQPISGKDYNITYAYSYMNCTDGSMPDTHTTGKKSGVNLAPGESANINIAISDYGLKNVAIRYNVPMEQLYNGMKLYNGDEYQQYLKEAAGTDYDWLSSREATPEDLKNKSQDELRIMRNWIYARHGYIFKSQDLSDYFSKFPWYHPTSKDVTSQFNKIEQANIRAIQAYE